MASKSKRSLSEIFFYVCAALMTFSIFMFFMENLKWSNAYFIEHDITIPSFLDLMFGREGTRTIPQWPVVGGMVALFIFQIILTVTCLTIGVLYFFKKISKHTAVCILVGIAVLALVCGVMALCSKLMIDRKNLMFHEGGREIGMEIPLKDLMKLNYGAYVYGITMIVAALGSLTAFILEHNNK